MDDRIACKKLTEEIIKEFLMPRKLCYDFIYQRIQMGVAVGVDIGRKSSKYGKPVASVDEFGNIVNTYITVSHAAQVMGVNPTSISRVCSGKKSKCKGLNWKFMDPDDFDTYRKKKPATIPDDGSSSNH